MTKFPCDCAKKNNILFKLSHPCQCCCDKGGEIKGYQTEQFMPQSLLKLKDKYPNFEVGL